MTEQCVMVMFQKNLSLTEQSIQGKVSSHRHRPLKIAKTLKLQMSSVTWQGIKLRCRQMCKNYFHKFTQYTHFLSVQKMTCLD